MIKRKVINGYTSVVVCYDRALRDIPYAKCGVNLTRMDESISFHTRPVLSLSTRMDGWKLREPIRRLPASRSVDSCGNTFRVSVIKM